MKPKRFCRTKWFGNPRIHCFAEEDKKLKLTTINSKVGTPKNKEILTRPIKIKKRVLKYLFACDFTYVVLCTLMTAIRWTSEPSHQFLWRQVTGWCGRQQHRTHSAALIFEKSAVSGSPADFPWRIFFRKEWSDYSDKLYTPSTTYPFFIGHRAIKMAIPWCLVNLVGTVFSSGTLWWLDCEEERESYLWRAQARLVVRFFFTRPLQGSPQWSKNGEIVQSQIFAY